MNKAKLKIVLLGSGNLAFHLGKALSTLPGYPLIQIYARSAAQARAMGLKFNCKFTDRLDEIEKNAGLYVLCISDDQLSSVAQDLSKWINRKALIAHTSGSTTAEIFSKWFSNYGVLYPLQTFTKGKKVVFHTIPWLITASNKKTTELLHQTAGLLSQKVTVVDEESRLRLHLAAVLVNNFPNYIYDLVYRFLEERKLNFDLLIPLLDETLAKIKSMAPALAQTGPAKRRDKRIIDLHLQVLQKENQTDLYQIYQLFTRMIWKGYPGQ